MLERMEAQVTKKDLLGGLRDGGVKYQLTVKRLKKRANIYSDIPSHPKLRQLLKEYKGMARLSKWLFPSTESIDGHLSRIRTRTSFLPRHSQS
jgi:hypothetical protein